MVAPSLHDRPFWQLEKSEHVEVTWRRVTGEGREAGRHLREAGRAGEVERRETRTGGRGKAEERVEGR